MWRFAALLVVVAFAGCGGSNDGGEASNKLVVAAFYPLAWGAGQIASPDADVVNLTPPGAEPHDVELSPGDVESVHDADLVLYLGGGFQPALEHALAGRSGRSVDLLEDRTLRKGSGTEADATADPHVWLDPRLFAGIVREIGRALGRPEPAAELAVKLRTLDRELQAGLERCERREIVTSHAAFGYLARRYGLEQIALTGLSPGAEPSPGDLVRLVDAVRASGTTTVFFETLVPPDLAETVAREAGAKTAVLDPLEGLTQAELDAGEDYFSVMRANLAALRKALGCP